MTTTAPYAPPGVRRMANKVPEVTIYFWVIKILCTTVGETVADYLNTTLGLGLNGTSVVFAVAVAAVLAVQFRLPRYVPGVYWLAVVLLSVLGTLLTDNLTDKTGVPLWVSTTVFSVALAVVFGTWWVRERTLSIHSITTTGREAFYWLAILLTFALGTASGDWTLQLTGWTPGYSVLLPVALIAGTAVAWRLGINAVLTFWVAYVLTRPLGANLGDLLSADPVDGGLGLGRGSTSLIFLATILALVVYLTRTGRDRTDDDLSVGAGQDVVAL